jgi:hypothetical protein
LGWARATQKSLAIIRNTALVVMGCALTLTSCSKDASKQAIEKQATSKEIAQAIMKASNQKLAKIEDHIFMEQAIQAWNQIESFRSNKTESGEYWPLADFFVIHEGAANYFLSDLMADAEMVQCIDQIETITVEYDAGLGAYMISTAEITHLFDQLLLMADTAQLNGYDIIQLIDFNLVGVEVGLAEIEVTLCVGGTVPLLQTPVFQTPSDPIWATGNIGWCPTTTPVGFDAATFARAYLTSRTYQKLNPCPPGTQALWAGGFDMNTYGDIRSNGFPYTYNEFLSEVVPRVWKGANNTCIPGDNTWWNSYYNDLDFLIGFGLGKAKQSNPNFEFVYTDFHSHQPGGPGWFPSTGLSTIYPHFHGGLLFYAQITCQ